MKLTVEESSKGNETTFNWTKVELKLLESLKMKYFKMAFNWTKVELKLL